jgi:AraC-like DNA-binding protein
MLSQHWAHGPPACPAVQTVTEVAGPYPPGLVKAHTRIWVLDYEFTSFGRTGIRRRRRFVWFPRPARTVHLYAPGVTYWEDPRGLKGRRHSAWIDFTGGEAAGLGRLLGPNRCARFLDPDGAVGALFHEAAETAQHLGEGGFWAVQGRFCEIVQHLLAAVATGQQTYRISGQRSEGREESDFVRTVREFLRANLDRKIALEQVARHAHVSVSSLAHRYRREAGESVHAGAIRMKVEQARLLLLRGHSVKVVAHQLGFSDASHLSKTFKRHEGVSPTAFLRPRRSRPE